MPKMSNNVGVRARVRLMFEICSTGTVLPSYDSATRKATVEQLALTEFYLWMGFGLTW